MMNGTQSGCSGQLAGPPFSDSNAVLQSQVLDARFSTSGVRFQCDLHLLRERPRSTSATRAHSCTPQRSPVKSRANRLMCRAERRSSVHPPLSRAFFSLTTCCLKMIPANTCSSAWRSSNLPRVLFKFGSASEEEFAWSKSREVCTVSWVSKAQLVQGVSSD